MVTDWTVWYIGGPPPDKGCGEKLHNPWQGILPMLMVCSQAAYIDSGMDFGGNSSKSCPLLFRLMALPLLLEAFQSCSG